MPNFYYVNFYYHGEKPGRWEDVHSIGVIAPDESDAIAQASQRIVQFPKECFANLSPDKVEVEFDHKVLCPCPHCYPDPIERATVIEELVATFQSPYFQRRVREVFA